MSFAYDKDTKVAVFEWEGMENAKVGHETLKQAFPANLSYAKFADSQVADIQHSIAKYEEILDEQETEYADALAIYKDRRATFIEALEEYGYDWSLINDNPAEHRWAKVRETIINYYKDYDEKIADDPSYVPSDADLKTKLATPIANYLINVVEITDNFGLDQLVVLDPTKPDEYTRMSAALLATSGDFRKERLITEYTGANGTPEAMADYLIKDAENLSPMANYPYPTEIASWDVDKKAKLYPSVVGDMLEAARKLYDFEEYNTDLDAFTLVDIAEDDIVKIVRTQEQRLAAYATSTGHGITPSAYKSAGEVEGKAVNVVATEYNYSELRTEWKTNNDALVGGDALVIGKAITELVIGDLNALLENQADLTVDQAELDELIAAVGAAIEKFEMEYELAEDNIKAANDAVIELIEERYEIEYNNRVNVASDGSLNSSQLSLAEMKYALYKDLYDTYEGYLKKYEIVDEEGNPVDLETDVAAAILTDIEKAIRLAEEDAVEADAALEDAKAILAAWVESGYDLTRGYDLQIQNNNNLIAAQEEILADLQKLFETLTAQKDALIALLESENVTE